MNMFGNYYEPGLHSTPAIAPVTAVRRLETEVLHNAALALGSFTAAIANAAGYEQVARLSEIASHAALRGQGAYCGVNLSLPMRAGLTP